MKIILVQRGRIDGQLNDEYVKVKQMFGTSGLVYYGIPDNIFYFLISLFLQKSEIQKSEIEPPRTYARM